MKYLAPILLIAILVINSQKSQAQNNDSFYIKPSFWGYSFYKGTTKYSMNDMLEEVSPNKTTFALMKNAKNNYVFSQITSFTGGFLVGIPLGRALAGGEPNWALLGIGAGLIAISIPLTINFKKKANEALFRHNTFINNNASLNYKPAYRLGVGSNGLNFQVRF